MADSATVLFRPIYIEDLSTSPVAATTTVTTVLGLGPGVTVTPVAVAAASDAAAAAAGVSLGQVYLFTGSSPFFLKARLS